MEKIIKIIAAIFIVLVLPILLYIFWFYKDSPLSCHQSLVVNCISCLIAVANALLLFATLLYQGKSFSQERFETTLFNLLESHRDLLKKTHFRLATKDILDGDNSCDINNVNLFDFAHNEISMLKEIIKKDSFQFLSENDVTDRMSDIENSNYSSTQVATIEIEKEKRELNQQYQLSQRWSIYGMTESILTQKDKDVDKLSFSLFLKKWEHQMAPYLRSLMLMFNHIALSHYSLKKRIRYRNYIIHQMPDKELSFLKLNYCYNANKYGDSTFENVLDKLSKNDSFIKNNKKTVCKS